MRTHAPPPDRRIDTEALRPQRPQERSLRMPGAHGYGAPTGGRPPVPRQGAQAALREGQRAHPVRLHRTTRPGSHRRPGLPISGHGTGLKTTRRPASEAAHGDQQHQGGDINMTEATLPRRSRTEVTARTARCRPNQTDRPPTGTTELDASPGAEPTPAEPPTAARCAAHHTRTPVPATRPDTPGPPLARRLPEPQGRRRRSPALAGTRTTPTGHQPRPPNPILVRTRLRRRGVSPGGRRRTCSPGGWCRSRLSLWGGGRA